MGEKKEKIDEEVKEKMGEKKIQFQIFYKTNG